MSSPDSQAHSSELKISPNPSRKLSKTQLRFNELTAKIDQMRRDLVIEREKLDFLASKHNHLVLPILENIARAKVEVAILLDQIALSEKFSKRQSQDIGRCISHLMIDAMEMLEPTGAWEELYARWAGMSYEAGKEQDLKAEQSMMEDVFAMLFGIDVDLEALKNDPEARQKFEEQVQERERSGEDGAEWQHGRHGRKNSNGKANKNEAQRKAAEELKSKSVRSIYISLAKLLHPDLETDPGLKLAKEEEMKKVSAAYEANDLATLLRMEMEWLQKEADHLGRIPEEKLKLYVEVLKDQVKELESEKSSLRYDENFANILAFSAFKKENGLKKIKEQGNYLQFSLQEWAKVKRSLAVPNAKKIAHQFVHEYLEEMESRGPGDNVDHWI